MKAFDIEMEEFDMVDDFFNDNSTPQSMLQKAASNTVGNPALWVPLMFAMTSEPAAAKDGAFGPMECLPLSLAHPTIMFSLLIASLFAADAGWKWRTIRTDDTSKQIKALEAENTEMKAEDGMIMNASKFKENEEEIVKLRKKADFVKGLKAEKPRDQHKMISYTLLGGGVSTSIFGAFNTFSRTGKLFPGPHLYAGAAITAGWAIAASLVPAMEKGDENARNAHIAINTFITGLFVWQVYTGAEITYKVLTKGLCVAWPGVF